MAPPYTGRCFCEAVQYRITEEPLTFYACHCTDCQKRSGSAFGLSLWVIRPAIEVTHGDATLQISSGHDDRLRHGRVCIRCHTRLWSEPENRPQRVGAANGRVISISDCSSVSTWIYRTGSYPPCCRTTDTILFVRPLRGCQVHQQ